MRRRLDSAIQAGAGAIKVYVPSMEIGNVQEVVRRSLRNGRRTGLGGWGFTYIKPKRCGFGACHSLPVWWCAYSTRPRLQETGKELVRSASRNRMKRVCIALAPWGSGYRRPGRSPPEVLLVTGWDESVPRWWIREAPGERKMFLDIDPLTTTRISASPFNSFSAVITLKERLRWITLH